MRDRIAQLLQFGPRHLHQHLAPAVGSGQGQQPRAQHFLHTEPSEAEYFGPWRQRPVRDAHERHGFRKPERHLDGRRAPKVILSNVQVLTAGTRMEQDQEKGKPMAVTVVTLLVYPEQSERLALAIRSK